MNIRIQQMRNCPFDAAVFNYQRSCEFYQSGRMDMLFNLVDAGVLELDVAADYAGMSVEEADDMLQGWITAQRIQGGFFH